MVCTFLALIAGLLTFDEGKFALTALALFAAVGVAIVPACAREIRADLDLLRPLFRDERLA